MDDNATKGLHLGAGLIMTIVLIGAAITIVLIGVALMNQGGSKASTMANDLANQQYTLRCVLLIS